MYNCTVYIDYPNSLNICHLHVLDMKYLTQGWINPQIYFTKVRNLLDQLCDFLGPLGRLFLSLRCIWGHFFHRNDGILTLFASAHGGQVDSDGRWTPRSVRSCPARNRVQNKPTCAVLWEVARCFVFRIPSKKRKNSTAICDVRCYCF